MKDENKGIPPLIWLILTLSMITVSVILPYLAKTFTSCDVMEAPADFYIGQERDTPTVEGEILDISMIKRRGEGEDANCSGNPNSSGL